MRKTSLPPFFRFVREINQGCATSGWRGVRRVGILHAIGVFRILLPLDIFQKLGVVGVAQFQSRFLFDEIPDQINRGGFAFCRENRTRNRALFVGDEFFAEFPVPKAVVTGVGFKNLEPLKLIWQLTRRRNS